MSIETRKSVDETEREAEQAADDAPVPRHEQPSGLKAKDTALNYVFAISEESTARELTLQEFISLLWRSKWIILVVLLLTVALTAYQLKKATPKYTASMVIAPLEDETGRSGAGGVNALGQIIGIQIQSGAAATKYEKFKEMMGSVATAEALIQQGDWLKKVYKGAWDEERQEWIKPQGLSSRVRFALSEFFGQEAWAPPSAVNLAGYLRGSLLLAAAEEAPDIVKVSFDHPDPELAGSLLSDVYQVTDDILRRDKAVSTSANIEYLNDKISNVSVASYRLVLLELLAQQETTQMLIQTDAPFAAKVLDPVHVSSLPTSPKITLWLAVGVIAGLLLGLSVALVIHMGRT